MTWYSQSFFYTLVGAGYWIFVIPEMVRVASWTVQALSETNDHLGFKSTIGAGVGNYSGRRRETGPLQEGKNRGI